MRPARTYPSMLPGHKSSVLPPETQRIVMAFGDALFGRGNLSLHNARFRRSVADLPANSMPRASEQIRAMARLYPHSARNPVISWKDAVQSLFKRPLQTKASIKSLSDTAWLFLHHPDGWQREKAVKHLQDPPKCDFELAVICYRLNDWGGAVRDAAKTYLQSELPRIDAPIVARNLLFFLGLNQEFRRWTKESQITLMTVFDRQDVALAAAEYLLKSETGAYGYALQQLLERPNLDRELANLAQNARLPSVRRVAYDALIHNRARWIVGYSKGKWDARPRPQYATRQLAIMPSFETYLAQAAQDRAAHVRAIAADALIDKRHNATSHMDDLAKLLEQDRSKTVRSRAAFYMRKREGDT